MSDQDPNPFDFSEEAAESLEHAAIDRDTASIPSEDATKKKQAEFDSRVERGGQLFETLRAGIHKTADRNPDLRVDSADDLREDSRTISLRSEVAPLRRISASLLATGYLEVWANLDDRPGHQDVLEKVRDVDPLDAAAQGILQRVIQWVWGRERDFPTD
jgi:hypothetical protein